MASSHIVFSFCPNCGSMILLGQPPHLTYTGEWNCNQEKVDNWTTQIRETICQAGGEGTDDQVKKVRRAMNRRCS